MVSVCQAALSGSTSHYRYVVPGFPEPPSFGAAPVIFFPGSGAGYEGGFGSRGHLFFRTVNEMS